MTEKQVEENAEIDESVVLLNSVKGLFEIGQSLIKIDRRLGEFCLFLSERTLSLGEERGYDAKGEQDSCQCSEECSCEDNSPRTPLSANNVQVMGDQTPMNCVGHTNDPQPKVEPVDAQTEVKNLVDKIRAESSNA